MRLEQSLKSLLRTPFKTILTFLLIAAASFALFSRVTDYAVTSREMNHAERNYSGVSTLDNGVSDTVHYQYSNMPATVNMINPFYTEANYLWGYAVPDALTHEQIEAFTELSEFATIDVRYMTGGIIKDYRRLKPRISETHDWGYDYTARFVIEGTYSGTQKGLYNFFLANIKLGFTDIENLAGDIQTSDRDEITIPGGNEYFDFYTRDAGAYAIPVTFEYFLDGNRIGIGGNYNTNEANSIFMLEGNPFKYLENHLTVGSRYIIIGRYIPITFDIERHDSLVDEIRIMYLESEDYREEIMSQLDISDYEALIEAMRPISLDDMANTSIYRFNDYSFRDILDGNKPMRLGDNDTIDYVPSIFELSGDYHESEEYLRALEIIDITNQDLHTFDIVYTQNMRSIPRFNEGAMVISEGRMLGAEDEFSCVASQYFLDAHNLKIGDTLTIELGDRLFEQNAQKGAIAYIPERRWSPIETVELEIVGAYLDTDPDYERNAEHYWGYSPNTIFVPLLLLPITPPADHEIKPGEFSLIVENIRNIPAFLEAAEPLAAEMGLTLRFSDGNWANIQEHLTVSVRASLITAVLYILSAVLALLLAIYLFIWRNKHTYAIMRALGVPCKKVNNWLSLPLGALSVFAVPIGGVVGLVYTMQVISREYITDTSFPVGSIILCFVLELAFIALIAMFFLRRLAKKPPLELLQGDIIRVADIANVEALVGRTPTPTPAKQATIQFAPAFNDLPQKGKYSAFRQVLAYILKHISRVKWKTAISLTLAVVLTGALGVLTLTRYSYQELFKSVDVISTVTAFNSHAIDELLQSELARDLYFYSDFDVAINLREVDNPHTITNDIERFLQGDYTIEYANGFSNEIFQGTDALCVLGSFAAETLEVKAGDEIILMPGGILQALNTIYYGSADFQNTLRQSWGLMDADDEVFFERLEQEIQEQLTQASTPYKVVGIIHSEDFTTGTSVFTPAGESAVALHSLFNDDFFAVKYSQFIVGDNEKINELSAFLYELKGESREAAYFIDTAELDNIKRVWDLILLLFPVAVVGVVLIGLTAPGLIIIQSAKEAAILRVLGVTKKRVRCMLCFEQIGLCVIGIALAAGGLMLYNSGLFSRRAETLAVCGVLYLLGCVCAAFGASVSVTRRRILELLQVKE